MVEINFLPWREYRDVYQHKISKQMLVASIILAILSLIMIHSLLLLKLKQKEILYSDIQKNIANYADKGIQSLNVRRDKNSTYQFHPFVMTSKLFHVLAQSFQENMCFTAFRREQKRIYFTGLIENAEELTIFLKNWQISHLFSSITIDSLQNSETENLMQFSFHAEEKE